MTTITWFLCGGLLGLAAACIYFIVLLWRQHRSHDDSRALVHALDRLMSTPHGATGKAGGTTTKAEDDQIHTALTIASAAEDAGGDPTEAFATATALIDELTEKRLRGEA